MDAEPCAIGPALRGVRAVIGVTSRSTAFALEQVTPPRLRVLVLLQATAEPLQVGALATLLGVSPSAATRFAARMERDGWVERRRPPHDRRAVSLHLTAKGARLVREVRERREQELAAALERLSEGDRRAVVEGLTLLADSLQEPPDEAVLLSLGFEPADPD